MEDLVRQISVLKATITELSNQQTSLATHIHHANDEIVLQHYRSQEQFANIFTNPLACESFVYLRDFLGIVNDDRCN